LRRWFQRILLLKNPVACIGFGAQKTVIFAAAGFHFGTVVVWQLDSLRQQDGPADQADIDTRKHNALRRPGYS
jgi:hypothetical protein